MAREIRLAVHRIPTAKRIVTLRPAPSLVRRMARTSAAEWAERIERWKRSGLGAEAFAAREGISRGSLSWWKWHLKTTAAAKAKSTALVPVRIVARREPALVVEPAPTPIESALPSGARLRVARGVDEETLVRVVRALETACS